MEGAPLEEWEFIWLVGSLCRINRLPFDPRLLLQRFPAPHSRRQLIEVLRAFGFRTGDAALDAAKFPCVAFLKGEATRPAILVRRDAQRLLYFPAGSQASAVMPLDEAAAAFEPAVLVLRHENAAEPAGDGAEAPSKFGFRWFWKELLKHRAVCRNVLVASLFIQLVGFSMPLGTQVVIDKVVVHQTHSTLVAIAVGLVMFLAFNALMTWLRQYFLIHTGNRVDAVLGSQVFRHILRLYLPYFEHRPTGVLVARVHAVETIRDFLAGAAVSLILDLPFLLVFVAVMFFYSW